MRHLSANYSSIDLHSRVAFLHHHLLSKATPKLPCNFSLHFHMAKPEIVPGGFESEKARTSQISQI